MPRPEIAACRACRRHRRIAVEKSRCRDRWETAEQRGADVELTTVREGLVLHNHREIVHRVRVGQGERAAVGITEDAHPAEPAVDVLCGVAVQVGWYHGVAAGWLIAHVRDQPGFRGRGCNLTVPSCVLLMTKTERGVTW